MALSNFERMLQLAEDAFAAKNDPDQLDVDEKVIEHLQQIHPASVSEFDDGNGAVVWILMIPTTHELMQKFIHKQISEQELADFTPLNIPYEAIYLCSAMVLPEYRSKGIAKGLSIEAIKAIRKTHPVQTLFVWPFSAEGDGLAESIAGSVSLPLLKRDPANS